MSEKSEESADVSAVSGSIWNRNFIILTWGTVVSLAGANMTGFATSLFVYDETGSPFLFALFCVLDMLPCTILPLLCGPFLDKFSRRKVIYTLDFMSGALYAILAACCFLGFMNYWIMAAEAVIFSSIKAVYSVAYESFYPMVADRENLSKAFAVTSTIETIVPYVQPVGWIIYRTIGLGPLFLINMCCYVIAAIFETQIRVEESYVKDEDEAYGAKQYIQTFKDGISYLSKEKGLLAITLYFMMISFSGSALEVNMIPFFKDNIRNGELLVQIVMACNGLGRIVAGSFYYKHKLPADRKFLIAIIFYFAVNAIEGTLLLYPVAVMCVVYFLSGSMSMTTYNIRMASTQSYVPDDRKGRFNGTFNMLCTLGAIAGTMAAGALSEFFDIRIVIACFTGLAILLIPVIFLPRKEAVKQIYNQDV